MPRSSFESDAELVWAHSREGWLRVDWPSGLVRAGNLKVGELCGSSVEEILGQPFWNLFERESAERLRDWCHDRLDVVGCENADPYATQSDAIKALAEHYGLELPRESCYPYA